MTTTTNVPQVKLNIMTKAQYNAATKSPTELYMVTDADPDGQIIQVSTLPTADATEEGKIYQYVGNSHNLTNIHYKYNFYINPRTSIEFSTLYPYDLIFNTYPNYIDLSYEESVSLKYFAPFSSSSMRPLRLNLEGNNLECRIGDLLNCILPASHFKNKTSGYYYTYHENEDGVWQILYDADPIYVKLLDDDSVVIRIKEDYNKNVIKIGKKGTLYFTTDYNDTENNYFDFDSDRKTNISTVLLDEQGNEYDVICKIWKQNDGIVKIFCDLNETLKFEEQMVALNLTRFNYSNHSFIIYAKDYLKVNQLDCEISFIYSNPQLIDFDYVYDEYKLIYFRIGSYKGEKLYLQGENHNARVCDEIHEDGNELYCLMSFNSLKTLLTVSNEPFKLFAINDNYGTYSLDNVFDISFNISVSTSFLQNIKITNVKLINNVSEINSAFAYKTGDVFNPPFMTKKTDFGQFISFNSGPLVILKIAEKEENSSIGIIPEPVVLDNIHFLFNITIGPLENYEVVNIKEYGTHVQLVDPDYLDLTFPSYLYIDFIMENPQLMNNLKLNPDSDKVLECINLIGMKKCKVTQEHFKGIYGNNNFYLYHDNHLNETSIDYSSGYINIRLPPENYVIIRINLEDNKDPIQVGKNGVVYFVTNYEDERNILQIMETNE